MSFIYHRIIRMQETDATGRIYFTNQLKIALEAFEDFIRQQGFSLACMVQDKKFLFPIVHAEADYFESMTVGEKVDVTLEIPHIGNCSFTHRSEFKKEGKEIGVATIVHALYSCETKESIPIPKEFKNILKK